MIGRWKHIWNCKTAVEKRNDCMKIANFRCENLIRDCVTDNPNPVFSYMVESEENGVSIRKASIAVGDECMDAMDQKAIRYT